MFEFFFNDTATTEIYTLSLHDALPISGEHQADRRDDRRHVPATRRPGSGQRGAGPRAVQTRGVTDRKSTRLNSSHANISYAVFCLKKKKSIHFLCISTVFTPFNPISTL